MSVRNYGAGAARQARFFLSLQSGGGRAGPWIARPGAYSPCERRGASFGGSYGEGTRSEIERRQQHPAVGPGCVAGARRPGGFRGQGSAGGRLPVGGHCCHLRQRSRRGHGPARGGRGAQGSVHHHQAVERQARLRRCPQGHGRKPGEAGPGVCGPVPDPLARGGQHEVPGRLACHGRNEGRRPCAFDRRVQLHAGQPGATDRGVQSGAGGESDRTASGVRAA